MGQRIYQRNCLHCHGVTLDGKEPDDAELEKIIKEGKRFLGMHHWEDTLTEEQVHDLIAYIRSVAPHVEVKP